MREILFRGKRKDNGGWVEGDLRQDKDIGASYISGWNYYTDCAGLEREPFEHEVVTETVGQYTGIRDSNGRKIFEGDIIKVVHNRSLLNTSYVKFRDGGFWCELISGGFIDDTESLFDQWYECGIEVIGNIHDKRYTF